MSNRSGDIDPFIIPFIMEKKGLSLKEVMEVLVKKSGLLGISGISGDMRDIEVQAEKGDYRAKLAVNIFVYHAKKYIGAYASIMGGVDVLVFTGGIGENSHHIREMVCQDLEFLGIDLDPTRNQVKKGERIISSGKKGVIVIVIPTNEEIIVAREVLRVIQS